VCFALKVDVLRKIVHRKIANRNFRLYGPNFFPYPASVCGRRGGAPFDSAANILRYRTIHCLDGIGENIWVEVALRHSTFDIGCIREVGRSHDSLWKPPSPLVFPGVSIAQGEKLSGNGRRFSDCV
jgi:hypothetical protein